MLTLSPTRKNKINLADYNWTQDVQNRILMADFSTFDVEVLEEILFSSLKTSFNKLKRALDCEHEALQEALKKLEKTGLVQFEGDTLLIDKETRKYFEFQITRFDPDFKPDMEFAQNILKKVPIQLLPTWYAIPRTSNNIFESIVERYLATPHLFQRYLSELNLGDPVLTGIINDVYKNPLLKVSSSDIIAKYNLKREDFEEAMLILEFNFVACLCYEKEDDHWHEFVTPFHEWKEYLEHVRNSAAPTLPAPKEETSPFAFVETLSDLLSKAKAKPFATPKSNLTEKLVLTKLASYENGKLISLESGIEWLALSLENRALYLYRHAHNRILSGDYSEKLVREAEKSVRRVLHGGWVEFEPFFKSLLVHLGETSVIALKRIGKQWKYTLPTYSDEEKSLVKATVLEWLSEAGMTQTAIVDGKECFALTHFGKFFFAE